MTNPYSGATRPAAAAAPVTAAAATKGRRPLALGIEGGDEPRRRRKRPVVGGVVVVVVVAARAAEAVTARLAPRQRDTPAALVGARRHQPARVAAVDDGAIIDGRRT